MLSIKVKDWYTWRMFGKEKKYEGYTVYQRNSSKFKVTGTETVFL